ncbi:MAG TPA: dihydroneopterin aldolase [Gemmatimonadaceae bacterium]
MVISLVGMRFHVRIGILSHERVHAQPLEIDVAVTRPDDAALLDYRVLYETTAKAVAAEPLDYLEEVAAAVADDALALPEVRHVRVAVRKPHVMLEGPLSYAEIVVERTRD